MRTKKQILADLTKERAMLKTVRSSYNRGMKRAMYTNRIDNFDTLDDLTSMNVHQDTISQLKKELNESLPLRD